MILVTHTFLFGVPYTKLATPVQETTAWRAQGKNRREIRNQNHHDRRRPLKSAPARTGRAGSQRWDKGGRHPGWITPPIARLAREDLGAGDWYGPNGGGEL